MPPDRQTALQLFQAGPGALPSQLLLESRQRLQASKKRAKAGDCSQDGNQLLAQTACCLAHGCLREQAGRRMAGKRAGMWEDRAFPRAWSTLPLRPPTLPKLFATLLQELGLTINAIKRELDSLKSRADTLKSSRLAAGPEAAQVCGTLPSLSLQQHMAVAAVAVAAAGSSGLTSGGSSGGSSSSSSGLTSGGSSGGSSSSSSGLTSGGSSSGSSSSSSGLTSGGSSGGSSSSSCGSACSGCASGEELAVLEQLQERKQAYREQFGELQMLRSELDYTGQQCRAGSRELMQQFTTWFLQQYGVEPPSAGLQEGSRDGDDPADPSSPSVASLSISASNGTNGKPAASAAGVPASATVPGVRTGASQKKGVRPAAASAQDGGARAAEERAGGRLSSTRAAPSPARRRVAAGVGKTGGPTLGETPMSVAEAADPDAVAFYNAQQLLLERAACAGHRPGAVKKQVGGTAAFSGSRP
ncbi:hypothetical protein QJQ45_027956 [Haematococcus lacustris]|nr:hypothetical protein QJQ45_027956 [Haematococcus lacustris]